jgi:hypothetical protein
MIGLAMLTVAIAPVYLEPVFNKFKPLADSPLKQEAPARMQALCW